MIVGSTPQLPVPKLLEVKKLGASILDIFRPPSKSQHMSRDKGVRWKIDSYSIKIDPFLHMGSVMPLKWSRWLWIDTDFPAWDLCQSIFNLDGYEDLARSNLVVTTIQDTDIHYITYQGYKYSFFSNEKGEKKWQPLSTCNYNILCYHCNFF